MADGWARFHEKCGSGVILSEQGCRAARKSPGSEFDNGLVFSARILPEKTVFAIEVEEKTSLWSGSLSLGVTQNDPSSLSEIPSSISHLHNGTWALAGSTVLKDGFSLHDDYAGNFEDVGVGDKVGLIMFSNGELHFMINGRDMGCAARDVPRNVFVVVDVYGRCSQVKLCADAGWQPTQDDNEGGAVAQTNELCFHEYCGSCVKLSNNRRTIVRPNPNEDFNNGIALTQRPLACDEALELEIESVIEKWAGSLEIGVTTHPPGSFQLPATMTNIRSGTWMFSGGAIVHNGSTVLEAYGKDIATYQVGDKLALCVKSDHSLHFYYNGVDLGEAASDLPSPLYAVVDLYGQAIKVSIVNSGPITEVLHVQPQPVGGQPQPAPRLAGGTENQVAASDKTQPRFSEIHGRLISLTEDRTGASRLNALTEFNHAVVISEQPLQDDTLFEIEVEKTTDRWSGSIEVALLSLAPPDLQLPPTLTDLDHHTWVLSGRSVMHDGTTIMNGYGFDLDAVEEGTRVGVMRKSDGTFRVFVDGQDKGIAATMVPPGVYAAIDLYGRCVQVAIVVNGPGRRSRSSSSGSIDSLIDESMLDLLYSFHSCGGENIGFRNHGHTAVRTRNFDGGLVCSDKHLTDENIFEIRIDQMDHKWTGSLSIGVASSPLASACVPLQIGDLPDTTVYLSGAFVFRNGVKARAFGISLDSLKEGSRIGVQCRYDGSLHVYIDSHHKGMVANNIPENMFGIVDVYGTTSSISIVNTTNRIYSTDKFQSSDEESGPNQSQAQAESVIPDLSFHSKCGLNIIMDATCTTAWRNAKFNDGVVFSRKPLANNEMFQVRVDSFNLTWSGSLAVGVIGVYSLEKLNLSSTAVSLRLNSSVVVHGSLIYINGVKSDLHYGCNFDDLRDGDRVGVICDDKNRVHVIVNDIDQGFIDHMMAGVRYAVFDLYGRCQQISVLPASSRMPELRPSDGTSSVKEGEGTGKEDQEIKQEMDQDNDFSCLPCEYKQCCIRFQTTLGIPEQYFTKNITCFCLNCSAVREESNEAVSGDPPQEYRRPGGWCKFELRLPPSIDALQVYRVYHVAYIGVHVGAIRRTLDRGTVLPPRKSSLIIGIEGDQHFISPFIERAVELSNERSFSFTDTTSCKRWTTQVAFEMHLPSNAYSLSPNSKTELENRDWCLDTPRKLVLTGLLVRLTEEDR